MRTFRLLPVLAALFALTLFPGKAADEPIDIYAIISTTGPAAFVGGGEVIAFGAAEKYVNANGGVNGRPIHFVIQDDQSSPAMAVQIANQVFAKKPPIIIGPGFGATCAAVLPLLANGPVAYCLSNTIHPPNGSFAFSASPSTRDFTAVEFRYLKAKGVKKIALLTSTDASGQDGEAVALENLRAPEFRDMQLVANEHFAVADLTVTAQLARIKAAGAEAIDAWTTGTPFGTVLRAVAETAYDGVVMTNAGNLSKVQMDQYAQVIPAQMIFSAPPLYGIGDVPAPIKQARATYLEALRAVNVTEPDLTHFIGWDPAIITVDVLRHVGPNATAQQARDYLLKLHDFPAGSGLYDFRRGDQRGIDPLASVVVRWDKASHEFQTISKPGGLPL